MKYFQVLSKYLSVATEENVITISGPRLELLYEGGMPNSVLPNLGHVRVEETLRYAD